MDKGQGITIRGMENTSKIDFNNPDTDKLKKRFESGFQAERDLLHKSIEEETKAVAVLMAMESEFDQLFRDAGKVKFGKMGYLSIHQMKSIRQSYHFAGLHLLRGSIRGGMLEMRFFIEESCNFVYFLNNEKYKDFEEKIKEKMEEGWHANDEKTLKEYNNLNQDQKRLIHAYVEEINPDVNKTLKEAKSIINEYYAHANSISAYNNLPTDFPQSDIRIDPLDSEDFRNKWLRRSIVYTTMIMSRLYTIICIALEKRSAAPTGYKEKTESINRLLKTLINPPGSTKVWK